MKPAEEYILKQSIAYQSIILHVRAVVEKVLPETDMFYKWGFPYIYYKKKPFCYLYVNTKKQFLDVGFAKGFQLKQNQEYLIDEKRNTIKSLHYFSIESIDNEVLIAVIKEAQSLYL